MMQMPDGSIEQSNSMTYTLSMSNEQRILIATALDALIGANVEAAKAGLPCMPADAVQQMTYMREYIKLMPSNLEGGSNCAMWVGQNQFNDVVRDIVNSWPGASPVVAEVLHTPGPTDLEVDKTGVAKAVESTFEHVPPTSNDDMKGIDFPDDGDNDPRRNRGTLQ